VSRTIGFPRWSVGAALLVGAAVGLSACASTVPGRAVAAPSVLAEVAAANAPLTSAVLGDVSTLDACGLISDEQLATVHGVRRAQPESFDECTYEATGDLRILVGLVTTAAPSAPVLRTRPGPRGLTVGTDLPDAFCSDEVGFPDKVQLKIAVEPGPTESTPGRSQLCAVADTMATALANSLAVPRRELTHRSATPGSLITVDACALMPDSVAAGLPGGNPSITAQRYPAHHRCDYGDEHDSKAPHLSVLVGFGSGTGLTGLPGTTTETLGGRSSVVDPLSDTLPFGYCTVTTNHKPAPAEGTGVTELAVITVYLPEHKSSEACQGARAGAGAAWPKLPPA
jgi:hypothetical protein